tara:strand:+ start:148 stop:1344 length:1197 start_codon:yes stop_codon:yes gene_type:complete
MFEPNSSSTVDPLLRSSFEAVTQFSEIVLPRVLSRHTSPETKFGGRSSEAVQAYARVRAEHGKRRALPSPEFSLNARIPTLPNCVQEGDFNLASTALQNCTTSCTGGVLKALLAQHLQMARSPCRRGESRLEMNWVFAKLAAGREPSGRTPGGSRRSAKSLALARVVTVSLLLISGAELASAQVVQVPSVRRFSSTGGMLIPDRGTGSMGGVSSYQSGRSSRGRFSPGVAQGGSTRAGNTSVSVTIIDHDEIDRQLLGNADPRQLAKRTAEQETIADVKALVQNARRLLQNGDRLRAQGTYELALHRLVRLSKQRPVSRTKSSDVVTTEPSDPSYILAYASREYVKHFGELPAWVQRDDRTSTSRIEAAGREPSGRTPGGSRRSAKNPDSVRMTEVTP